MSRTDVVVTGLGATTPLGGDVASTWDAMLAGRSGVSALTQEWAAQLPVRIAAQLAVEPSEVLDRVKLRRLDRSEAIALIAAQQAWADAGLADSGLDPERLAVSVGSGIGGAQTLLAQDDILEASGPRRVSPHTVPMLMPNGPAAWVGLELGAKAGVHSVASACATGAEAIALGLDMIRVRPGRRGGRRRHRGGHPPAADRRVRLDAGHVDPQRRAGAGVPPVGQGPRRLRARRGRRRRRAGAGRPRRRPRRPGLRAARRRRHHLRRRTTSCSRTRRARAPSGPSRRRSRDAGLAKRDIVHVNAHATSTPVGDMAEIVALHAALGDHPVLTATKSMTGHLLGAAGALESIATILAIRDGVVPPTINLDDPDDGLDLDVAAHKARQLDIPAALNNSFGFGGHNVALVFTRA